jgi:hypothetical protein
MSMLVMELIRSKSGIRGVCLWHKGFWSKIPDVKILMGSNMGHFHSGWVTTSQGLAELLTKDQILRPNATIDGMAFSIFQ